MSRPLPPRLWVCVPGVQGEAWRSGGLLIALRAAELLASHLPTTVATTHDEEPPHPTLESAFDCLVPDPTHRSRTNAQRSKARSGC